MKLTILKGAFFDIPNVSKYGFSAYRNVIILWDPTYTSFVTIAIDNMPQEVREKLLVAASSDSGHVKFWWDDCNPPDGYEQGKQITLIRNGRSMTVTIDESSKLDLDWKTIG